MLKPPAIIWAICLFLFSTAIHADFKCPPVPKKEEIAVKKAGRYFSAGATLAEKEKYLKSLDRYLCSLQMKAHANTMFNIAQVLKLVEFKKPAVQRLKKFRKRNPEHPSVGEISLLIERLEGNEETTAEVVPADPVSVEEEPVVENTVAEEPHPEAAVAVSQPAIDNLSASSRHPLKKQKVIGTVMVATGGAFAALGIGTAVGASLAGDSALSSTSYSDFQYYEKRHTHLTVGSVISSIAAAALITGGVVVLVKYKKKKQMTDTPVTSFTPLTLTIRF